MNSVSERPINIQQKPDGDRITFADVAMRIARDGPMYGVILLVGFLAASKQATANESILGAALALLARSWPNAIQTEATGSASRLRNGVLALTGMGALLAGLQACQ
jgi:hypothetical protein